MSANQDPTLSVYRGQSLKGIGEGPGLPVPRGEQFLAADDFLGKSRELLATLRPWMTLDARAAEHKSLGDRLEAWSLLEHGKIRYVCRLSSAPAYDEFDQRAAYFAHGRAWPPAAREDPGLYLGCTEAFEPPWPNLERGARASLPAPLYRGFEAIKAEPVVAELMLAQLIQAMVRNESLIISTTDYGEFTQGAALHQLVAFARLAMPDSLKRGCNVRVYTERPEAFLSGSPRVRLMVVHEGKAIAGLQEAGRRQIGAVLMRRNGEIASGDAAPRSLRRYASAVVKRAISGERVARQIAGFSARVAAQSSRFNEARWWDSGSESLVASIPVTFNLASASGDSALMGSLLRDFLTPMAEKRDDLLGWDRLLSPSDWGQFPDVDVTRAVLNLSDRSMTKDSPSLRAGAKAELDRRKLLVDGEVDSWWKDGSLKERFPRLLELFEESLVGAEAVSRLTAGLPLEKVADHPRSAVLILAEAKAGSVAARDEKVRSLGRIASHSPGSLKTLLECTRRGQLSPRWVPAYVEECAELGETGFLILDRDASAPPSDEAWARGLDLLMRKLVDAEVSPQTVKAIERRLERVSVSVSFSHIVTACEVLARNGGRVRRYLEPHLRPNKLEQRQARADRRAVVGAAVDPAWECISVDLVVRKDGRLLIPDPWLPDVADLLAGTPDAARRLKESTLAALWALADRGLDGGPAIEAAVLGELDRRLDSGSPPTMAFLQQNQLWERWRAQTQGGADLTRKAALTWLSTHKAEASYEQWSQIMQDLQAGLTGMEISDIHGGTRTQKWPWISPFESEQIEQLAARCLDYDGLAVLIEVIYRSGTNIISPAELANVMVEHARLIPEPVSAAALNQICNVSLDTQGQATLEEAICMARYAILEDSQAPKVLVKQLVKLEPKDPARAYELAMIGGVLTYGTILKRMNKRIIERGYTSLPEPVWAQIDENLGSFKIPRGLEKHNRRADDARIKGWMRLHRLMQGDHKTYFRRELSTAKPLRLRQDGGLPDVLKKNLDLYENQCVVALFKGKSRDGAWRLLEQKIHDWKSQGGRGTHPVSLVIERLQHVLPQGDGRLRATFYQHAWSTFIGMTKSQLQLFIEPLAGRVWLVSLASLCLDPDQREGQGLMSVAEKCLRVINTNSPSTLHDAGWWHAFFSTLPGAQRVHGSQGSSQNAPAATYMLFKNVIPSLEKGNMGVRSHATAGLRRYQDSGALSAGERSGAARDGDAQGELR